MLEHDPNIKIRAVLKQEPFASQIAQGLITAEEVETAIYGKLYHEEESSGIQQMIAQFYNKFDELHE